MSRSHPLKILSALTVAGLLYGACGCASETAATQPAALRSITTSSGFRCPDPQVQVQVESETLNLFVRTENIPPDIQECFELVYGVDVIRREYSNNQDLYGRMAADRPAYDLIQVTDYLVAQMIRQGLLQKLDKDRLHILQNYDPDYMNFVFDPGNEYTLPYQAGTYAIVVNTDAVSNVPLSWADLWRPEFSGRMVFVDESPVVIAVTLLALGYEVDATDRVSLDRARSRLAELVPRIKLFDSDSPKTALSAGNVDLGMTLSGEAFLANRANPAIQYIYPAEGAIFWLDNWAIPAGAPHPDAAYAWLNYTLQEDVFWMMLRDFPYINPNEAALNFARENHPEIYEDYISSAVTSPPPGVVSGGHMLGDVGEMLDLYNQIWSELRPR